MIKYLLLYFMLLLTSCTVKPVSVAPVVVVKTVVVPVPAPPITTIPVAASRIKSLLHNKVKTEAEAKRYVSWSKAKPPIIYTLTVLKHNVDAAVDEMLASKKYGHFSIAAVHKAAFAISAMQTYLDHKGND